MNANISTHKMNNLNQIRTILFTIDINPKYASFEYLVRIIDKLLTYRDFTQGTYIETIINVAEKFNISPRTLSNSINYTLRNCDNNLFKQKNQFNIKQNSTLNKIRIICKFVQENLCKVHQ